MAEKMQVGSIFRWVIGYERSAGPVRRVSQIVFRDLPAISQGDLSAEQDLGQPSRHGLRGVIGPAQANLPPGPEQFEVTLLGPGLW